MDNLFSDCPCEIIVDDLLIWGATEEEHDQNLLRVLQKAREVNLKPKLKKFKFEEAEVSWSQGTSKISWHGDLPFQVNPRLSQISTPLREVLHKAMPGLGMLHSNRLST